MDGAQIGVNRELITPHLRDLRARGTGADRHDRAGPRFRAGRAEC